MSYYRYRKAGVDKIKMEQVLQIVQYGHQAIEVKEVRRVKKRYHQAADKDAFSEKICHG